MPTIAFARRAAAAAALAALAAALLTGCFSNPVEDLVNQGVEDAVEGATGGDVSLDGELPAGFPESIPLVDGEIAFGAGAGGEEGWIVIVTSTAADPVADAVAELEGAGFTKDTELSGAGANAARVLRRRVPRAPRGRRRDRLVHGHPAAGAVMSGAPLTSSSTTADASSGSIGGRIGTILVAFAIGAVYGAVATIGHRATLRIGEVAIPWGLVAALVGVTALILGIRLVVPGRAMAAAAAAGIVVVVALLTLPGPGGSVLVVGDLSGTIWSIAPALISVLVVAWPELPATRRHRRSPRRLDWNPSLPKERRTAVTYVIALPCVDVKDRACIDECPVDCIYEGERSLYIHPDECVDCGACEPVCPVEAIYYEDDLPDVWADYYKANVEFFDDIGSPGGAAKVGVIAKDHPVIAALPPQAH